MSDESQDIRRLLADAIEDSRDRTLDDERLEQIRQLLLTNAEARRVYLEHNQFSQMLSAETSVPKSAQLSLAATSEDHVVTDASSRAVRPVTAYAGWVTAATILIACGVWSYVLLNGRSDKVVDGNGPGQELQTDESPVAVITQQIDARWVDEADSLMTGRPLDGKWLRLQSGIVQVEFSSGAQLALQGPAELRIDSDMECFLQKGKLTVLAPPEASRFTVRSPTGNVIDLGTEFGLIVDPSGQMDVHVLDGEVELEVGEGDEAEKKRLLENEAASIDPNQTGFQEAVINREEFEAIRHDTLIARRPLKLQFDCGVRAGVYQGTQSPGHVEGDFLEHEVYWNAVIGDQSGSVVLADGSISPNAIEVDYGRSKDHKSIDWDAEPDLIRATRGRSRGMFATALGEDNINGMGETLALRFRGLPIGTYRVYLMGRSTMDHPNWGNYLAVKAFRTTVGVNLNELPEETTAISPLDDPDASNWVEGQTHMVGVVELSGPDDYLTVMSHKDRDASPKPQGGRSTIVGLQIIQITEQPKE